MSRIKAIQIVNPLVLETIAREVEHGAGRNATEAAENLILQQAERRQVERATTEKAEASAG